MNHISACAAGLRSGGGTPRGLVRARAVLAAAVVLLAQAACKDSVVPNFRSPQFDPLSPSGIQTRLTGVVSQSRVETGNYMIAMGSFARDAGNYTTTDDRYITEWQGAGTPISNSDFYGTVLWDFEFRNAKNANSIITDLPNVKPAYSASDLAAITGIAQTFKAYNFMLIAETHDTLGVPVGGIVAPPTTPAPLLCTKDVWAYIVAVLDSGFNALNAAAPGAALPVQLPTGYANVGASAGPSTTPGTFAAFNRALAAKAGVELAFAVARSAGGTPPTPASAGAPDLAAFTRADSAARASALFPATPTAVFVETTNAEYSDPSGVYHSFSGASGDIPNPIQGGLPTLFVYDSLYKVLAADTTPTNLGRFGKLLQTGTATSGFQPAFPNFADTSVLVTIAGQPTFWSTGKYPGPGSPIPIIRGEILQLYDAVAQLGLGNNATALALINGIHTSAGEPAAAGATYAALRDQLLQEFRMSGFLEAGGDRAIMIRNYGMQTVTDNTWRNVPPGDTHATVVPIPTGESSARGGNTATVCP